MENVMNMNLNELNEQLFVKVFKLFEIGLYNLKFTQGVFIHTKLS